MLGERKLSPPVTAAATAVLLCAAPQPAAAGTPPVMLSAGIAFSVSFGRAIEVGLGLDLRLLGLFPDQSTQCSGVVPLTARAGLGPYGQAGWYSKTGWRFGAGLQGGGEISGQVYGLLGELGWSYRRAFISRARQLPGAPAILHELGGHQRSAGWVRGSHGLHFGLLGQATPSATNILGIQLPIGLDLPLSSTNWGAVFTTGIGLRAPGVFGPYGTTGCSGFIAGRPLREDGEVVLPKVVLLGSCPRQIPDDDLAAALGEAWLADARAECASVPAFLALARDLAEVGAPPELIAAALSAAGDEIRHTVLCSRLASRFLGVSVVPVMPPVPAPRAEAREETLRRLAVESWADGLLGEGAAAVRAERGLRHASDGPARRAQAVIARDEAKHADLAGSVLDFCLQSGGKEVRDAVAARVSLFDQEVPQLETAAVPGPGFAERFRDHGRISCSESECIWYGNARAARARVERMAPGIT